MHTCQSFHVWWNSVTFGSYSAIWIVGEYILLLFDHLILTISNTFDFCILLLQKSWIVKARMHQKFEMHLAARWTYWGGELMTCWRLPSGVPLPHCPPALMHSICRSPFLWCLDCRVPILFWKYWRVYCQKWFVCTAGCRYICWFCCCRNYPRWKWQQTCLARLVTPILL